MLVSDGTDLGFTDSSVIDSASITSGNSSGGFDWGGLFTSFGNAATSIVKATSSPSGITAVKAGQTYVNAQGQLITVPPQGNYTTLIMVGIGLLLAFLLVKRLA
jgi:hypothetical protein